MVRSVEETKRLILDAATAEFAARGLSDARVDRIAELSGVNKRMIHVYFGGKEDLFDRVLTGSLGRMPMPCRSTSAPSTRTPGTYSISSPRTRPWPGCTCGGPSNAPGRCGWRRSPTRVSSGTSTKPGRRPPQHPTTTRKPRK